MRSAAERFIADKTRIASVLNSLKTIHFIHILSLFYERIFNIDVVQTEKIEFCENALVFYHV